LLTWFPQHVRIETQGKGGAKRDAIVSSSLGIKGRTANIVVRGAVQTDVKIAAVYTIGKDGPTPAEAIRADVVRGALQRTNALLRQPFVQTIWRPYGLPATGASQAKAVKPREVAIAFDKRSLNLSQRKAVSAILDDGPGRKVVVVHGGPGTGECLFQPSTFTTSLIIHRLGKTTVISAAVISLMADSDEDRSIWLVAQSNVAVKNIAEKLADFEFLDFRLLVSQDFHYDW
jgi:hypothetical protein